MLVDRDGYEVYDLKGKKTDEFKVAAEKQTSTADLIGADSMTDAHFANFIAGIRKGEKLNAPVSVGNVAVTMLQLSNVAWFVNRELNLDAGNGGKIKNDSEAMKYWNREYEKGWEPKISVHRDVVEQRVQKQILRSTEESRSAQDDTFGIQD